MLTEMQFMLLRLLGPLPPQGKEKGKFDGNYDGRGGVLMVLVVFVCV